MFAEFVVNGYIGKRGKFTFDNRYISHEVAIRESARFISADAKIHR